MGTKVIKINLSQNYQLKMTNLQIRRKQAWKTEIQTPLPLKTSLKKQKLNAKLKRQRINKFDIRNYLHWAMASRNSCLVINTGAAHLTGVNGFGSTLKHFESESESDFFCP